jgi:uncharacterized membrane protein (DUF373 family)
MVEALRLLFSRAFAALHSGAFSRARRSAYMDAADSAAIRQKSGARAGGGTLWICRMLNLATLRKEWKDLTSYERFEQVASRIIILFVSVVIVYSLVLVAIELFKDFKLGPDFMEKELLQDIFGSILTVLILLEFNHSIALSLTKKSGIIQARTVVLIAILVVARKIILLDFKTVTTENLLGFGGIALALGVLYWLISVRPFRGPIEPAPHD